MKKLVSLVLSLCIILSCVHITPTEVSAASSLSDSQITAIVENYLSIVGTNRYWNANIRNNQALLKEQVDNGDYLSATTMSGCKANPKHSHSEYGVNGCTSNVFTGVSRGEAQCWGFGDYIEYVIFKTTNGSNWTKHYSVDSSFKFRPGDLIWSQKGSYSQHIRVVYKVVGSTVYVIEGNGDGHCKIMTNALNDPHSYVNYSSSSYVLSPPSSLRNDSSTPPDTEAPTITDGKINIKDISGESFTVECNLNDNVGVTRVWLNVWGPNGSFKGYELPASNGTFSTEIKTTDYGGAGYYTVHISAFDAVGNESEQAKRSDIYAYTDTEIPTITNLKATNISGNSFTVECDLNDNVGVTRVWLNVYGPSGSKGYGLSAPNGSFSHTISTSEYGGAGIYSVHLYAYDSVGNASVLRLSDINAVNDIESPVISNLHTSSVNSSSFTINCNLNDNIEVTRVWLNIYGPSGSKGYGLSASNGSFSHTISTSEYGGAGIYTVHVYAFDERGNSVVAALNDINAVTDSQKPVITLLRPTNVTADSFTINGEMYDNVGVTRVWLNIYGPNGSNGYTIDTSNNSFSHTINTSDYGGSGYYSIHAYAWDEEGNATTRTLNDIHVENDYSAPVITELDVSGISDSSFTINCTVNEKIVRAWLNVYGPNYNDGYSVHLYGDSFMHTIDTSKYGGAGSYEVHVYVWDTAGNESGGRSTGTFVANKRYTVNFNANQGTTPISSMIVTNSTNYGSLPTPNRTGYTFAGWYTLAFGGTQITDSNVVWLSSAQTLYAHWNPNIYNAYLDANGGNIDKNNISITYDSTYYALPTPTRKGYIFLGWYTAQDGGSLVTNDTKVTVASNQTLYAQWEKLIPSTTSSVSKRNIDYHINVTPTNIEDSCEIIISGYKSGKLVTLTSTPYTGGEINTTLTGDIDEIKVMVWDSLDGMKPLCEAEVIPSSEFIVE